MNRQSDDPGISADHPGGNIVVKKQVGDRVWLSPDFRHMQAGHEWFYWSFRARNVRTLTAVFSHRNFLARHGPAVSRDGGHSWRWLGRDAVRQKPIGEHGIEMFFEVPPVAKDADVRYAFCPQYQESDLHRWAKRHAGNPFLEIGELCKSRKGRAVELVRISGPGKSRKLLWLMARNHSCEAMASFTLEGMLEAALGDDPTGRQLREKFEIVATPFMDKDGVEEGDQGKLRHPHDHNRDYTEHPIHPEVAAAMQFGRQHQPAIAAFLDLHGPMVHGPWDNRFYLVGSAIPGMAAREMAFMNAFGKARSGPIDRHGCGVLRFGEAWNTDGNFASGKCSSRWAAETFPDAALAASFEIPYANADDVEVNPETARALGRDMAKALLDHLVS